MAAETKGEKPAQGTTDVRRRKLLAQFGRLAAAAPITMILLSPRQGRATHKPGHEQDHTCCDDGEYEIDED